MIILKSLGIILLLLLLIAGYFWLNAAKNIIDYIAKNPSSGSIYVVKNGEVVLNKNADQLMPLASTVKIIVAIEFVKQITSKQIDIDNYINLNELEKYHIKGTDGGAHSSWLQSIKEDELIQNNRVSILEVAKGMIEFSSNANTEYLMHTLGFDNLNKLLKELDLNKHEKLYPFVSSLFVIRDHTAQELEKMTKEEYVKLSFDIHKKLKNDDFDKTFIIKNLTKEDIKLFSDFFIQGTTKEYISISEKLNNRDYFLPEEYEYIDYIMTPTYPSKNVLHSGFKGGSTRFILTELFYETYKNGDTFEIALFLNNLTVFQYYYFSLGLFKIDLDIMDDKKIVQFQKLLSQ